MVKGKNVLTTGEVAKICNVAPRTVSKWFDSGQLKGYRIPGSKDRRIPVNELIRFMRLHNMPTPAIAVGKIRVLIADAGGASAVPLAQALQSKADFEVKTARGNFETGVLVERFAPHVLLINLLAEGLAADEICRGIREDEELQTIKIIALAQHLSEPEAKALLQKGFDDYVCEPADVMAVIKKIDEATAIVY